MNSFSKNTALLALGLWLGCAIFFPAVVVPTLFNLDGAEDNPGGVVGLSRPMAGAINGHLLRKLYVITYVEISVAIFFLGVASFGQGGGIWPRRALALCVLVLGLNALNDLWIHDRITKLQLGITNAPSGEAGALQKEFDLWHRASTGVYGGAVLVAGIAACCLIPADTGGRSAGKARSSGKK